MDTHFHNFTGAYTNDGYQGRTVEEFCEILKQSHVSIFLKKNVPIIIIGDINVKNEIKFGLKTVGKLGTHNS